jgi:copper chaperone
MKKLIFKTTLKCAGCEATVRPHLEALSGIGKWETRLQDPDKLLSIETDLPAEQIVKVIEAAGFKAELLSES